MSNITFMGNPLTLQGNQGLRLLWGKGSKWWVKKPIMNSAVLYLSAFHKPIRSSLQ
ncbi:hypothetical protein SAMN04489735_101264 [Aneurinibacillus thermoaerophilus]|uniref:Uncharacterized protein n=1 Tax=Aneurinibacillus thermoaerophilus TaxID=143495 RepID=A0A1G7ZUL7_ANETH|nr:hypothetical protein SAMN04489735_101264 [Aneurinibacillus thermoaerophilus]